LRIFPKENIHKQGNKRQEVSKAAFTLAEVLITIGIIGVVAAITIPNMITNYQKKATVAKLKEDYAVLSQAIRTAKANDEDIDVSSYADKDPERALLLFEHYLKPYLKIAKLCIPSDDTCWKDVTTLNGQYTVLKNGSRPDLISLILMNGQTAYIWGGGNPDHMQVWINVNGLKNKAILGKDVFGFFIFANNPNQAIYPAGGHGARSTEDIIETINDSQYGCTKSATHHAGYYCGAKIEHDGWKISKDYPW